MLELDGGFRLAKALMLSSSIYMHSPTNYSPIKTVFDHAGLSESRTVFADGSEFSLTCLRLKAEQGVYTTASRSIPAVRVQCEQEHRSTSNTAVWLFGGPFASYDENLAPEQLVLLGMGYELLIPLYIGSAHREYEFVDDRISPDMDEAVQEIVGLVEALQESGPVLLVGESFGGLLASVVAANLRKKDSLLLLGPPLIPFRETIRRQGVPVSSLVHDLPAEKRGFSDVRPTGPVTLQNEPSAPPVSTEEQTLLSLRVLREFFGDAWLDRDPLKYLVGNSARSLIFMRQGDTTVGSERLQSLRDLHDPRIHLLTPPGDAHGGASTRRELNEFRRLLLTITSDASPARRDEPDARD